MQRIVSDYEDLAACLQQHKEGLYPLLVIQSPPGRGKSTLVKNLYQGTRYLHLTGRCTPVSFYEQLYQYQDSPIVLDDCDISHKDALALLLALCDNNDTPLTWHTKTRLKKGVPHNFSTSSPVCMLTNVWNEKSILYAALQDRGVTIYFNPSPATILHYAQNWITEDLYQYFQRYSVLMTDFSLRYIDIASQFEKQEGLYWQLNVLPFLGLNTRECQFIEIELSYPKLTIEERKALYLSKFDLPGRLFDRIQNTLDEG